MLSEEEKYYNKIMKQDKMSIEEAENIIDEMYQDKYKIIEENNTIYVDRLDEVKFTNLEFASVRMLREVQSLRRKLEKLQKEIERLNNRNKKLDRENQKLFEDFIENYIFKQEIRKKIEELNIKIADNDKTINECRKITGKNRGEKECIISRCRIKNVGYHETIKILQELLEGE